MTDPESIVEFWFDQVGCDGWYRGDAELDGEIRLRFERYWDLAYAGELLDWLTSARRTLAYIVLVDQFPRNMFRGTPKAFASDHLARSAAKSAICKGLDLRIEGLARQFFYLPLMHSECLPDQDRCVRLMKERLPDGGGDNLEHSRAHREIIRRFGRFPTRNAALARVSTAQEMAHLTGGGYGGVLETLRTA